MPRSVLLDSVHVFHDDIPLKPDHCRHNIGKVKSWFKTLLDASISDLQQFVNVFLDRWVVRQNPFLIIEEYNQLKRFLGEIVQKFSARFNQFYYSIPIDIRPPPGSALLHYPGAFDPKMEF